MSVGESSVSAHSSTSATGPVPTRSGRYFHLFAYGSKLVETLGEGSLAECELVDEGVVMGTLYDIDGEYPALVLAGSGRVAGEIWRCPVELLPIIDSDERVGARELKRVGVEVDGYGCWTYVVGPKLAARIADARRLEPERVGLSSL